MTKAIALVVAASIGLAATGCTSGNKQAPQGTTPSSASVRAAPTAYHPVIDPANFQGLVDNAWFPLKPGSMAVYRGSKDGEPVREVYEVTHGVQKIMGVPCVVVHDQLFHSDGSLAEDTFDFYTQDRQGNVWYFGEMTVALDDKEKLTDTEGSWLAGEDGAQPGIFMEANPTVGHTFRQEYYPAHAEDEFKVLNLQASVSVPFGPFPNALLTEETTVLEPGIVDHKYYAKGIGEVAELQVRGPKPPEELKLVSYTSG